MAMAVFGEDMDSISVSSNNADVIHGVQFFVAFPKTTFTVGEPIVAWEVFSNLTDTQINIPTQNVGIGLELAITNIHNNPVAPMTDGHGRVGSGTFASSLPGRGCISNFVEISRLYNLKPGIYTIRAKREMALSPPWGKKTLSSQTEPIEIIEKPAK